MKKDLEHQSDIELVELVRAGVSEAYGELWKRHEEAVVKAIRLFTGYDPDDIAQEAFLRIYQQIQAGNGPKTAFRAYAIMTARNIAINQSRRASSSEVTGAETEMFEAALPLHPDTSKQVVERTFVSEVFTSLPPRWQEVLWYREVEDLPVHECSQYLGLTENATSALLKRAKEGFKQEWIAAQLAPADEQAPECTWALEKMPQHSRGKLTGMHQLRLSRHLKRCHVCSGLEREAKHLHTQLAPALLPLVFGIEGARRYLASLQAASAHSHAAAAIGANTTEQSFAAIAKEPIAACLKYGTPAGKIQVVGIAIASAGALTAALAFTPMSENESVPVETKIWHSASGVLKHAMPDDDNKEKEPLPEKEDTEGSGGGDEHLDTDTEEEMLIEPPEVSEGQVEAETPPTEKGDETGQSEALAVESVPSPLSATPQDGIEAGVYPNLVGIAAPRATITLHVSNQNGQQYDQVVESDQQGRWVFTPSKLLGSLTVTGSQEYTFRGKEVRDETVVIGIYEVGHGLDISVKAIDDQQTQIRVTGLSRPSVNQNVTIVSSTLGEIAIQQAATAQGEVSVIVPHNISKIGDLRFWQGATSEGPRRVWWGIG